jgi:protein-disulfide isomerase
MTQRSSAARLVVPVTERDHCLGSPTAPVTLVEYGDFECAHCGQAYHVVKALVRRLGKQLRLVYRHFPLTVVHPHAELAAEAAEAAGSQNRFWQMHALLFEHQSALGGQGLLSYAASLELDLQRFAAELSEHVHAERIREDFMGGVRSGVNGTPTFFINGLRHDAPWDFGSLLSAVEAATPSVIDERRRPIPKYSE